MCLYVNINAPVLTETGTNASSAANNSTVRYCDYPGERLLQSVKFDVNGNPQKIDQGGSVYQNYMLVITCFYSNKNK